MDTRQAWPYSDVVEEDTERSADRLSTGTEGNPRLARRSEPFIQQPAGQVTVDPNPARESGAIDKCGHSKRDRQRSLGLPRLRGTAAGRVREQPQ